MKLKRKFTKSLIRPIFNALIGLIMLLSAAVGTVGYFEFSDALKEQYPEIPALETYQELLDFIRANW